MTRCLIEDETPSGRRWLPRGRNSTIARTRLANISGSTDAGAPRLSQTRSRSTSPDSAARAATARRAPSRGHALNTCAGTTCSCTDDAPTASGAAPPLDSHLSPSEGNHHGTAAATTEYGHRRNDRTLIISRSRGLAFTSSVVLGALLLAPTSAAAAGGRTDLKVTLEPDAAKVLTEEDVTYTARITNISRADASSVSARFENVDGSRLQGRNVSTTSTRGTCTVLDHAISCALGTVAPAEEVVITIVYRYFHAHTARVAASASSTKTDADTSNNRAETAVQVEARAPRIEWTLDPVPSRVTAGETVTYTIRAHNDGTVTSRDLTVDSAPIGGSSESASVSTTRGSCTQATLLGSYEDFPCRIGKLSPGESAAVVLQVRPAGNQYMTRTFRLMGSIDPGLTIQTRTKVANPGEDFCDADMQGPPESHFGPYGGECSFGSTTQTLTLEGSVWNGDGYWPRSRSRPSSVTGSSDPATTKHQAGPGCWGGDASAECTTTVTLDVPAGTTVTCRARGATAREDAGPADQRFARCTTH